MAKYKRQGVGTATGFSQELMKIVNEVGVDAANALDEAVTEEAKEVKKRIQTNARAYGWGASYVNGFTTYKQNTRFGRNVIIYNDDEYRLVHLLEFGHRIEHIYGVGPEGESPAKPHIQPAIKNLPEELVQKFKEKL